MSHFRQDLIRGGANDDAALALTPTVKGDVGDTICVWSLQSTPTGNRAQGLFPFALALPWRFGDVGGVYEVRAVEVGDGAARAVDATVGGPDAWLQTRPAKIGGVSPELHTVGCAMHGRDPGANRVRTNRITLRHPQRRQACCCPNRQGIQTPSKQRRTQAPVRWRRKRLPARGDSLPAESA